MLAVAVRTIESPIGLLHLAASEVGLVRVAFACEDFDEVEQELALRIGPLIKEASKRLDPIVAQFDEYFSGDRTRFDLPLDFALSKGFRQLAQQQLTTIPFGSTRTYAQVAAMTANPKAVRAVGSACATNPLPIVVPCHRVVRSDGGLGGYRGGIEAKITLLDLEASN